MILYGWEELNQVAWGIEAWEVHSLNFEFNENDELISCNHRDEGRWFRTFMKAKQALLAEVREEIAWRQRAMKEIRAAPKPRPYKPEAKSP